MNFERGISPKKSMRIGIGSQALHLRGIYNRNIIFSTLPDTDDTAVEFRVINGPDGHRIFKEIQENGIQSKHEKYWVHTGGSQGHLPIDWIAGRWIEYLKSYYKIPERDEF